MKTPLNIYKAITLCLALVFAPIISIHGQVSDSLLETFATGMASTTNIDESPEFGDEEAKDTDASSQRNIQDFTDPNYGYSGSKNFINAPSEKFIEEPLSYFGYDFFSEVPSTFASSDNIPIPPDYILGPNDGIRVILFGNKNITHKLVVSRNGDIFFPEIGPIMVSGLSFSEVEEVIQQLVSNKYIGTTSRVTMDKLRSINIFVLGEALQPGMYTVSSLSTLTNAILKNGGVKSTGSLRNIELKRQGEVIKKFDAYDLLLNGDTSNDERLMEGDVVFIPAIGKTVGIDGQINRPGIYELSGSETLSDLIKFAGNLKPKADNKSAEIQRVNKEVSGFDLLTIDLRDDSLGQVELENGDVLNIYPIPNSIKKAILISGHALQPGFYPWKKGMRVMDIISSLDDLLSSTDLGYLLVKRKVASGQGHLFLQVNLNKLFKEDDSENITLFDQDELILFPSLLTPELITTRMIQDEYTLDKDKNQMVLEDEWNSLTYLRKSLMEETINTGDSSTSIPIINDQGVGTLANEQTFVEGEIKRYYEYSIFDYCTIPEDLAIMVIESSGFRAKKSIPLEELEDLRTPQDFTNLQKTIERERIKLQETDSDGEKISKTITDVCRKQLLDPMLDIVRRDNTNNSKLRVVSVFGNVHFPGTYPYTDRMLLADALDAAGGSMSSTYNPEIELSRINNTGKKFIVRNEYSSMKDASMIELEEMDVVNLKQIGSEIKTVEITGEVFFPGTYPISEKQTLSELIQRAGGITDFGSAEAAFFQRESLKTAETERLQKAQSELRRKILLSSQSGGLGQASLDSNAITTLTSLVSGNNQEAEALGRLVIDLDGIIRGDSSDIILEDGDTIIIPKNKQSVSVIGEVFVSNSHIFNNRLGINEYISLSGGATAFADESNIYLIKSDGSIISPGQLSSGFFRGSGNNLEPGDTIVVPLQVQPFSGIKATTEVTQIIYQMALAAAAVNSF